MDTKQWTGPTGTERMKPMKLDLTAAQLEKLMRFLNEDPDAEQLSLTEYVVDLYDAETPLTINFLFAEDGSAEIAAAAQLLYDEGEDGWYMGDRVEDEAQITAALRECDAL